MAGVACATRTRMQIEHKPIGWFQPHPDNYREHPSAQVEQIAASLEQFGQFKNVVARPDGTVIAGHGVVAAAMQRGEEQLAVFIYDGDDDAVRKLMVADNELSRMAQDDDIQLAELLRSIEATSGLDGTGFDGESLAELLEAVQSAEPSTESAVSLIERWMIVIECENEQQQISLLKRFDEEGLSCRALIG